MNDIGGVAKHPSEADYVIRFEPKDRSLTEDEEGYDLVHEFEGKIIQRDESGKEIAVVGKALGQRVDLGDASEKKIPYFDVFDAHSQALCECYEAIFDLKTGDFRKALNLESFGSDVLHVESIEIIPEYRGFNLGLLTLLQTIKEFGGGCALVIIKPFPLQFSCGVDENKSEFIKGQKKLRQYWQQFGFRRVPKTDHYYFDLAYRLPKVQDLLSLSSAAR